ncbi:tetratricopeptide repeat protein [Sorangium sp. So ce124]|uniref:tetratricopeptide repeat protein n=1 Tax=Sorangium sp. So ce124 TaxID=3133280 RepID=UPI003F61D2EB
MSTSFLTRSLRAAALVTWAASGLGCAPPKPPLTCASQGGAPWVELSSEHFVMWTDLDRSEARDALAEFETSYNALEDVCFPSDTPDPFRMQIVLFARERDFSQFVRRPFGGYFMHALPNDLEPAPTMVMYGSLGEQTRLTFQHELAHHFIAQSIGPTPAWLSEGLAQFYSTLRLQDGYAMIGSPLPDRSFLKGASWRAASNGPFTRLLIPVSRARSATELIDLGRDDFYGRSGEPSEAERRQVAINYLSSWALVHMLSNGPEPYVRRFAGFLEAASRGVPVRQAFQQAIADIPSEQLDEHFRSYLVGPRLIKKVGPYAPPPPPPPQTERAMNDAEVHVLWARLKSWDGDERAWAAAHLEEALAHEPNNAEARLWRGRLWTAEGRLREAEQELTVALAARPMDPRYLLAMGRLLYTLASHRVITTLDAMGRAAPLVDRLSRAASTAAQLDFVARYRIEHRELDEAQTFIRRALKTDPGCASCYDTYGMLLLMQGRVTEAISAAGHALDLVPEGSESPVIEARLRCFLAHEQAARDGAPTRAEKCFDPLRR